MRDPRWKMLALLFTARTAMGFQFQSVASVSFWLNTDLHLGYAAVGTLIGLYMLPGIVIAFPGGLLTRRYGDRTVCTIGIILMIAGALVAAAPVGAAPVFAGRLIAGVGAVLMNLVLTKMAADWFAGREIVLAMGVLLASWPFGIAAGLLGQPLLAAAEGWRSVMIVVAAFCAIGLVLIATLYRDPPQPTAPPAGPRLPTLPPGRQLLPTLVASVMWGNLNAALVLFFSFAPETEAEFGLPPVLTAAWTGAALWLIMFFTPLGGLGVQHSGRPDASMFVFSLLASAALASLALGIAPLTAGVAFGILVGIPAGAVLALPARVLSPEHRAGGYGVFYAGYYLIMAAGPSIAGVLRASTGTAASAILFSAVVMASLAPLLGLFWALARHPAPEHEPAATWHQAGPTLGPEPARGDAGRLR